MEHRQDDDSLFEANCHYLNQHPAEAVPLAEAEGNDQPAIHACVPPTTDRTETK